MELSDLPNELAERGIWWQIGGFAVISAASAALLVEFEGSGTRAYHYLEVAVKTLYWANVFVLIGLFEGVRKMFEKASTLRARYRKQAEERAEKRATERVTKQVTERVTTASHRAGDTASHRAGDTAGDGANRGAAARPQTGSLGPLRRGGGRRENVARHAGSPEVPRRRGRLDAGRPYPRGGDSRLTRMSAGRLPEVTTSRG